MLWVGQCCGWGSGLDVALVSGGSETLTWLEGEAMHGWLNLEGDTRAGGYGVADMAGGIGGVGRSHLGLKTLLLSQY